MDSPSLECPSSFIDEDLSKLSLDTAIYRGQLHICKRFIKNGSKIGPHYFIIAVRNDHLHICKWLMDLPKRYGVLRSVIKSSFFHPLLVCLERHYWSIFEWILSLPKEIGLFPFRKLWGEMFKTVILSGNLNYCRYYFSVLRSSRVIPKFSNIFALAATKGYLDICKWMSFLPEKYNICSTLNVNEAFIRACSSSQIKVCEWMLTEEYGIDPALKDNWVFRQAAQQGNLYVCRWLLSLSRKEYSIDPAAKDNEAFRYAAANGYLHVCRWLIMLPKRYGIDPAAKNNEALNKAALNGYIHVYIWIFSLPKKEFRVYSPVKAFRIIDEEKCHVRILLIPSGDAKTETE